MNRLTALSAQVTGVQQQNGAPRASFSSAATPIFDKDGILVTAPTPFVRKVLLNRPKTLNSLDTPMIRALHSQIAPWEREGVKAIIIAGEGGKAFCAGGDIKALYEGKKAGDLTVGEKFFRDEYSLDYALSQMKATQVSVLDGIVMGGGVGISIHSPIRIATENSVFAMPETKIGLFTDVGGGYFLSRLRKNFGYFLGLTGYRVKAQELVQLGLADFFVPREKLPEVEAAVAKAATKDATTASIRAAIAPISQDVEKRFANEDEIERLFAGKTYQDIVKNLESANTDFAKKQLDTLAQMNAISLRVTFEQIRRGATLSLRDNFIMDYRLSQRFVQGNDFYEGVRTLLIDRKDKPKWTYKSAADVPDAEVESYFAPLSDPKKELQL